MPEENSVTVRFVATGKQSAFELMQHAFKAVADIGISVWFTQEECLKLKGRDKRFIYVFDDFAGDAFKCILALGNRIYGPTCILHCLRDSDMLPRMAHPVYCKAMSGIVISCTNISAESRDALHQRVQWMMGDASKDFHERVTHLVAGQVGSKKYAVAARLGKTIVMPEWIEAVWNHCSLSFQHANEIDSSPYQCPIFRGFVVSVSGMDGEERALVRGLVEQNGGRYSGEMKVNECTHLVLHVPKGQKYDYAVKWNINIVTMEWLKKSVEAGYSLDEAQFPVIDKSDVISKGVCVSTANTSTPAKQSDIPMSSTLCNVSNITVTHVNETALSTTRHNNSVIDLLDGLDMSILPRQATFLDGCKIFVTGITGQKLEKIRKIINCGGGTRYNLINESVSHVIGEISPDVLQQLQNLTCRPLVVGVEWLVECVKQNCHVQEEPYQSCNLSAVTSSSPHQQRIKPNSHTVVGSGTKSHAVDLNEMSSLMNHYKNQPIDNTSAGSLGESTLLRAAAGADETINEKHYADAGDETIDPRQYMDNVGQQSFNKSKSGVCDLSNASIVDAKTSQEAKKAVETLFNNCTFALIGFNEDSEVEKFVQELISENGGIIVKNNKQNQVLDYAVVPVWGCEVKQTVNEVVTNAWLQVCVEEGRLVDIKSCEIYEPFYVVNNSHPLSGCVLSISGYSGVERDALLQLAQRLGALCQEYFVKRPNKGLLRSTHLIVDRPEGSKYLAAQKWELPAVTKHWLFQCARMGHKADEDNYLAVKLSCDINRSVDQYDDSKSGKTDDTQKGNFHYKDKSVGAVNVKSLPFTRRESNVGVGQDIDNKNMTVNSSQHMEVFDENDYRHDIKVGDVNSEVHCSNVDYLQTSKTVVARMGVDERPSSPTGEGALNNNKFWNIDTAVETDQDCNRVPPLDVSNNKSVCKQLSVAAAADSGSSAIVLCHVDRAIGGKTVGESKQRNSLAQSTAAVTAALESGQQQAVSVLRNQAVELLKQGDVQTIKPSSRVYKSHDGVVTPGKFLTADQQFHPNFDLVDVKAALESPALTPTACHKRNASMPLDELFAQNIAVAMKNSCAPTAATDQGFSQSQDLAGIDNCLHPEHPSGPLKGVVIAVCKKLSKNQSEYNSMAASLGADYRWMYDSSCTHFIFQGRLNDVNKEFRVARDQGKFIVSPHWLSACCEQQCRVDEMAYPHTYNPTMSLNITGSKTPVRTTRSLANMLATSVKGTVTASKTSDSSLERMVNKPLSVTSSPASDGGCQLVVQSASPKDANRSVVSRQRSPQSCGRMEKVSAGHQHLIDLKSNMESENAAFDSTQSDEDIALACDRIEQEQDKSANTETIVDSLKRVMKASKKPKSRAVTRQQSATSDALAETSNGGSLTGSNMPVAAGVTTAVVAIAGSTCSGAVIANGECGSVGASGESSGVRDIQRAKRQQKHSAGQQSKSITDQHTQPSQFVEVVWDDPVAREQRQMLAPELDKDSESPVHHTDNSSIQHLSNTKSRLRKSSAVNKLSSITNNCIEDNSKVLEKSVKNSIQTSDIDEITRSTTLKPVMQRPIFLFSGLLQQEKDEFTAIVKQLGGETLEAANYTPLCTHLVVGAPTRNEKYLACVAAGKWVLHKSYLTAAKTNGCFPPLWQLRLGGVGLFGEPLTNLGDCLGDKLYCAPCCTEVGDEARVVRQWSQSTKEEQYEWGSPNMACHVQENVSKLALAARRWRQNLQTKKKGAFDGWCAILLTESKREDGFKRLLEAGGATIEADKSLVDVSRITHAFLDLSKLKIQVDLQTMMNAGIHCVKPEYIAVYLTEDPSPSPHLHYIPEAVELVRLRESRKRNLASVAVLDSREIKRPRHAT